jgi:hypothetical protein
MNRLLWVVRSKSKEDIVYDYTFGEKETMKLRKISAILFSVALLLVLPCAARAYPVSTVEIVSTGVGAHEIISVWGGGLDALDVYAGVYMLDKTDGTGEGELWPDGLISGFCAELSEAAPEIASGYSVIALEDGLVPTGLLGGPIGATKAEHIRELWGRFYDPSWAGSGSFDSQQNSQAAAFAAATWEIINEGLPTSPLKWDVKTDGTEGSLGFRSEYGDAATANSWLHALDGTGPKADLRILAYNGSQDYIAEVPEPATIALLGLSGVLGLLHRKRNSA